MEENKNYYFFKEEDLFSVLNFAKNYQLNETKQSRGRTNQGVRNFGGLLDAFLPGKLIEIAVCRILERYSKDKKFYPDFEIYSNKEVGEKSDPDITKIKENDINRKPNIFIEIKKTELNDRWLGPRKDQIKDMTNGFMIHASIKFDDSLKSKNQDVVASMLKKIISPDFLDLKDFLITSTSFTRPPPTSILTGRESSLIVYCPDSIILLNETGFKTFPLATNA